MNWINERLDRQTSEPVCWLWVGFVFVFANCYSIVELETSWEKETCIHVELGTSYSFLFGLGLFCI